ncbi:hypothetical protein, partial [uncultured Desulfovibrio sp.]|uniref:hypothetical protein n=1 Tax=uncultured Desulfovibrio sp. TaxID=167968 RepID=UPI00262E7E8F
KKNPLFGAGFSLGMRRRCGVVKSGDRLQKWRYLLRHVDRRPVQGIPPLQIPWSTGILFVNSPYRYVRAVWSVVSHTC